MHFYRTSPFLLLAMSLLIGCGEVKSSITDLAVGSNTSASVDDPVPTSPETPVVPEIPYAPVVPLWESEHQDGVKWTKHVQSELDIRGTDLLSVLPTDYKTFCPNYKNLNQARKKDFWAYLLSQMVRYESNFDPERSYKESFDDSNGDPVVSRGLLQLSFESGNDYGCGFDTQRDLHDPLQNLSCGIRILNRWMENDHRIASKVDGDWKGGARYWSVLRSTSDSYPKIVSAMKVISICK